jgi:hypothetical protein
VQTFEWAIESIIVAHPDLYLEHCVVMAVALMRQQSASLYEFMVECEGFQPPAVHSGTAFRLRVSWSETTGRKAQRIRHTEQAKSIVERAAVALAALLFAHLMSHGQMRVTRAGDRVDYWLPRLRCAPEVSGTENSRGLRRRPREKVAQVLWNSYVVVCCFTAPQSVIRWSYHAQEMEEHGAPKS